MGLTAWTARKLTTLFPDPSVAHQCQIISYNILRETKDLQTIKNDDVGENLY